MSTSSDAIQKTDEEKGIGGFIRETKLEWDKTTFPSSEEVVNTTVIVIISVIIIAFYLYLVDLGWIFLLKQLTNAVNYLAGI